MRFCLLDEHAKHGRVLSALYGPLSDDMLNGQKGYSSHGNMPISHAQNGIYTKKYNALMMNKTAYIFSGKSQFTIK